ncbi:MAG TPA: SURF1 family protein [Longimicrobiales bacterium]|nr:SURF1 family protein [Longimicrobiales bacterium]
MSRPLAITVAGVAGTLFLAVLVGIFVRLGFWQLDRLGERRALNRAVAARLDAPPVRDVNALDDTTGLFYRTVEVSGTFDNDRSIILPGRSRRGLPGIYLLTPLRTPGRADALLVNRGWVPSPDAATVNLADFAVHDPVTVRGLVLPFPDAHESLAPRDTLPDDAGTFRRVWYTVEAAALKRQFPYPLLDLMVQELPLAAAPPDAPRYPARLEPPPLSQGSHLGYALQWFAFAITGIIGWIAMIARSRAPQRSAPPAVIAAILVLAGAAPADAQLRPLEPMPWQVFEGGTWGLVEVGAGVLWDYPVPLAGARGRLFEGGNYRIAVRSGRMAMEAGGTAIWHVREDTRYDTPEDGVEPAVDGERHEPGVVYAASSLHMTPDSWPVAVFVRFGATIPTTSDESGLDRDRTDFFALIGARHRAGPLTLTMENGVGINGTLDDDLPQSDVWTFAFGATYDLPRLRAVASFVGRQDGHSYVIRGNEDLHELRVGFDYGRRVLLGVRYIRGLSEFSTGHGVRAGATLRVGRLR